MRKPDYQPTGLGKFVVFLSEAGAYEMEPKAEEISQKAKEYRQTIDKLWEASYLDSASGENRDSRWAANGRAMAIWERTGTHPRDFGMTESEVSVISQAAQAAAKSIRDKNDFSGALKTKIEETEIIEYIKDIAALSLALQRDIEPTAAKFISQDMGKMDDLYYAVNGHNREHVKLIEEPDWDKWGDNDDNLRAHAVALVDGAVAVRLLGQRVATLIDPYLNRDKDYFKSDIRKSIPASSLMGAHGKYTLGRHNADLESIESLADPDTQKLLQAIRPEVEKNIAMMRNGEIPNPLEELDKQAREAAERVGQAEKGTRGDLEKVRVLMLRLKEIEGQLVKENDTAGESISTLSLAIAKLNDIRNDFREYSQRLRARALVQRDFPGRDMTPDEVEFITLGDKAFATRAAFERFIKPEEFASILKYYGVDPGDPIVVGAISGIRALIEGDPEGKGFEASKSGYTVLLGLIRSKIEPEVLRIKKHDLVVLSEPVSPPQFISTDQEEIGGRVKSVEDVKPDSQARKDLRRIVDDFAANLGGLTPKDKTE